MLLCVQPWRQETDAIGRGQGRCSPVKLRGPAENLKPATLVSRGHAEQLEDLGGNRDAITAVPVRLPVQHRVVNRGEFRVIARRKLHDRAKG
jgi:hypothetical protein